MNGLLSLDNIRVGETVKVVSVETEGSMRRRFMDIGLTEGAVVTCVGISPLGDPKAFLIRGAVIAVRNGDSKSIMVIKREGEE